MLKPLFDLWLQSAQMGTFLILRAAVDPEGQPSGFPIVVLSSAAHDEEVAARLWKMTEKFDGRQLRPPRIGGHPLKMLSKP